MNLMLENFVLSVFSIHGNSMFICPIPNFRINLPDSIQTFYSSDQLRTLRPATTVAHQTGTYKHALLVTPSQYGHQACSFFICRSRSRTSDSRARARNSSSFNSASSSTAIALDWAVSSGVCSWAALLPANKMLGIKQRRVALNCQRWKALSTLWYSNVLCSFSRHAIKFCCACNVSYRKDCRAQAAISLKLSVWFSFELRKICFVTVSTEFAVGHFMDIKKKNSIPVLLSFELWANQSLRPLSS